MLNYRTPHVYIEELPALGPIQGVGTSTLALIGAALSGPINIPTKVVNWTQFRSTFGSYIVDSPRRFFLANAVWGFFRNGGTVAYIVRVATAVRAWRELNDRGNAGDK